MSKITLAVFVFTLFTLFIFVAPTLAENGILIAHGDHFEIICRDDGLVEVYHTILATANITQNVTCEANFSFDGTLKGEVFYEAEPEIHELNVEYTSNGTSMIFVNFTATLKPLKFTKLRLKYIVGGLLKRSIDGTWHFKHTFNTDSASSPEVLLKIRKPSQFHKLIIEDAIPAPHVFLEESHYYVLVWKSPLLTFGHTSTTYIDVSYRTEWDLESIAIWVLLVFTGSFLSWVLEKVLEKWGIRIWATLKKFVSRKAGVARESKSTCT